MQILDLWFKKTGVVKNNPEKLSTTKLGEHISCGYSNSTILTFDCTENKWKIAWKTFSEFLKEYAMKIINFEKKKIIQLSKSTKHRLVKKFVTFVIKVWK